MWYYKLMLNTQLLGKICIPKMDKYTIKAHNNNLQLILYRVDSLR